MYNIVCTTQGHRLVLFALVFLGYFHQLAIAQEPDVQERLSSVLEELNEKQDWLGQADQEIRDLQEIVRVADKNVADAALHIAELQESISHLESRIHLQQEHADTARNELTSLTTSVKWHFNLAYRLQRRHWLRVFFEQEDDQKNDRYIRYHQYFVNSKTESIDKFTTLLKELQETLTSLRQDRNLLDEQQKEWTSQRTHYNQESETRRIQIAHLNEEIEDTQRVVAKLAEDRQRLESLLQEIETEADSPVEPTDEAMPSNVETKIAWPTQGDLLISFGDSRADGRLKWQGIHIASDTGSKVLAAAPGKVVFADWLRGFGMMVIIDHGNELLTVYGYCDTLLARVGDNVEAGEDVATVGQSGGQTIPGLYFEVRSKGKSVDPVEWLEEQEP